MPSFAPTWFFDMSGLLEMLWNLNGWIVFSRLCYKKRAGSWSLSHWQVRSQEAQVIPLHLIFFFSLTQIWSKPLFRHTRNKWELLHIWSLVKISRPWYVTWYFQRCDFPPRKKPVAQKHRMISHQEKMAFSTPRRVVMELPSPFPRVCMGRWGTYADITTKIFSDWFV